MKEVGLKGPMRVRIFNIALGECLSVCFFDGDDYETFILFYFCLCCFDVCLFVCLLSSRVFICVFSCGMTQSANPGERECKAAEQKQRNQTNKLNKKKNKNK